MAKNKYKLPHILVADDHSREARAAAKMALQIAKVQNVAIRGLYIIEEVLALDPYADYQSELSFLPSATNDRKRRPISRAKLMGWFKIQGSLALDWLETESSEAGVPVTTKLVAGGVSELVLRNATRARLLAVGRRGHGHKDDSESLGHNFRKIAHHVHLPLLVGGEKTPSLHRILLAYHGQAHANDALILSEQLQRDLSAEVIVLTVREETDSSNGAMSLEEIKNRLAHSDLAACRLLTGQGSPAHEIAAVAVANDVDLIILGRYRHSAMVEWLVGSTVDRLLRATSLPVLIA
ncbi:MAG: universal stress protein [Desulfobacterales bacterium]|jgi:nucleotide-binding universal stress UspA family protein